jgi:hypothetical protein
MLQHRSIPIVLLSISIAICATGLSAQSTASSSPPVLPVANATIPTRVLSQSPADTVTDLQIICLFRSDPSNTLHGALLETNEKLKGLLDRVRKPELFAGDLGETLLIAPSAGTLAAKKLLIVGLGDSQTFTPERMQLVGSIAFREANRMGIAHPFFAPTVLDGGITKFTTGEVAQQFMRGFLHAAETERQLAAAGDSAGVSVADLTYLAGVKYASVTHDGLVKEFEAGSAGSTSPR